MLARVTAFVVWALAAATLVFWGLRLFVRAPAAPAQALPVTQAAPLQADLGRLLGKTAAAAAPVAAAAPEMASRFRLVGVMAPKKGAPVQPGVGLALIAVDGKPPRAFAPGARIDGELVLQSVSLRTASIGPAQGATAVTLELPPLAAASTGTLAAPAGFAPVVAPAPVPAVRPALSAGRPVPPPPPAPASQTPPAISAAPATVQREGTVLTQ
jgi:general secretion pathway protein C